jgi:hypothetical protein
MITHDDVIMSKLITSTQGVPLLFGERFRCMIQMYNITLLHQLPDDILNMVIAYVHTATIIVVNGGHVYRSNRVRPVATSLMYNAFFDTSWLPFIDYPSHHRARSHALATIDLNGTLVIVGGQNAYQSIRSLPTLSMRNVKVQMTAIPAAISHSATSNRSTTTQQTSGSGSGTTIMSSSISQWTSLIADIPSEYMIGLDYWHPSGGLVNDHYHLMSTPSTHIAYSFTQYQWYTMPSLPTLPTRACPYIIGVDTKSVPLKALSVAQLATQVNGIISQATPSISIGRANTAIERHLRHQYQPPVVGPSSSDDGPHNNNHNETMVTEGYVVIISTNSDRRRSTCIDLYYLASSQWLSMILPDISSPRHRYGAQTVIVPSSIEPFIVVIGGYDDEQQLIITTERLSLVTFQWNMCSSRWNLPSSKLCNFNVVWNGASIVITGGELGPQNVTRNCWSLDPFAIDATWRAAPRFPLPRTCHATTAWFG